MSSLLRYDNNIVLRSQSAFLIANDNAVESNPVNTTIEETLFDNRGLLKTIAVKYGLSYIDPLVKEQLFKQIDWLLDVEDWEEEDTLANPNTFKTLMKFILNTNPVQSPYLGLADSGNIIATWINNDNKLRLECMANDCVKWFVSCVFDGKNERTYGETYSLERLQAVLKPFENAGWFKENGKNI